MKYYPFENKPLSYKIVSSLLTLAGCCIFMYVVNRVLFTWLSVLFGIHNREALDYAVYFVTGIVALVMWGYSTFSERGVYVYYDRIVIKNGLTPIICRRINLVNITSVQYVFNVRDDRDYHRTRNSSNLIAGESGQPAAKLYTTNRGIRFLGVDDTESLVTDLQLKLDKLYERTNK